MQLDGRLSRMLHVLIHMDRADGPITSAQAAQMLHTNPVVVRRTMAGLREAGFVASEKGHAGGWRLVVPLGSVTMLDIYRAVGEPRIFAIGLADPAPQCLVEQAVNESMSDALNAAEAMLIARLGQVTLAQIARSFEARYASCEGQGAEAG